MMLAVFLALPASAAGRKATSIKELADMYDSSSCKGCHAEKHSQWEKSHHARPLMGLKDALMLIPVVKVSVFAPKDKDGKVDPKMATMKNFPCFKCHLPQALTSAEDSVAVEIATTLLAVDKATAAEKAAKEAKDDKAAGEAAKAIKEGKAKMAMLQIGCLVCHNDKAILHRIELGQPADDVLYGTKDVPSHPDAKFKSVKKSVILTESAGCGQCHGTGPNFDAENPYQCATLYGSYLHSYIPSGGAQKCQECHMKGGDHLIGPNWNDRPASAKFLSESISLDVQTVGFQFLPKAGTLVPMVVVNTKVGTKAGHRTPDG